ncbi:MAG TPA: alkaline phosphatase D family protein [Thermoanaerobaculia bacterium]|nr:alkaline phosphatase D family protein [Thermoanaerobaculia bacterium]
MASRRVFDRLQLGPIVGHTDDTSARIWIEVFDDPADYKLRVDGAGLFDFSSTEPPGPLEFRTAIAVAEGLRPDWRYRYSVLRRGRVVRQTHGTFRTMPPPGSMANVLFCAISCNKAGVDGLWGPFGDFVERAQPHFVLMMGDQVYIDEDEPDIFRDHLKSKRAVRREALAAKYRTNWSRDIVRRVMSNVPVYMMWDDHDIRDGWGSLASDSPALLLRYPRGKEIYRKCNAYFEDARDVYWQFQGCHNPLPVPNQLVPNYVAAPPPPEQRGAMPFAFRCGRLVVLVLDSRGDRDIFRDELPVLGARQWAFVQEVFAGLPEDVEALAVVTPTPIASMDPHGQSQKLLGDRTDDVVAFARGDEDGVLKPNSSGQKKDIPLTIANAHLSRLYGAQFNLGTFKVSNIDEARDQWSHKFARPEQAELLRQAGEARETNLHPGAARRLIFLSGDIHVGCIYDISSSHPSFEAVSLTASGISAREDESLAVGVFLDETVRVGEGVISTLREVVLEHNFGVVQVVPTGTGAEITPILAHQGNANSFGADLSDLV